MSGITRDKIRITKKKHHSQAQINSHSPPALNQKPIPIHFQYGTTKNLSYQDPDQPQFWGCIVPPHIQKLQKTLYRTINTIDKKNEPLKKKREKSSQLILLKYLKRKQKRMVKEPQAQELLQTFYETFKNSPQKSKITKNRNVKSFSEISPSLKKNLYKTQQQTTQLTEDQPRWDYNLLNKKKKEELQTMNKIAQLNGIIQWRSKVVSNIDSGISKIRQKQYYT